MPVRILSEDIENPEAIVAPHNVAVDSHADIRTSVNAVKSRTTLLESDVSTLQGNVATLTQGIQDAVSTHNTATDAHADIRTLVAGRALIGHQHARADLPWVTEPGAALLTADSASAQRTALGMTAWAVAPWTDGTTSDIPEGTQLYFTNARADARAALIVSAHNVAGDSHADIRADLASAVSTHNTAPDSHADLRTAISDLMSNVEEVDADFVSISYNPSGGGGSSATLEDEITTDAPTAYWQLTETGGNLADSAGGGRTLTVTGSPVYAFCQLVRNLTSKGLKVVHGAYASRASDNLGVTPPWTGSWSVEFVVMLPEGIGADFGCFTYGASGSETEATNYQIYAAMTASRCPTLIWEYGAGNNVTFSPQIVLPIGFKAHIVWTKDAVNKIVKCFVNGICVYSSNYTQEPTGGSSSTIDVGRASTGSTVTGVLGHVAVYMGAVLSDARVMAHAVAAGVA